MSWIEALALKLYNLLLVLLCPLLRRKLARRAVREPLYALHVAERWGRYGPSVGKGFVWLHAVSLGETRAAAPLVQSLRQQWPGMRLLLTHGTATGREQGMSLLREGDVQAWLPWDTRGAVERFLAHFSPAIGVLMETEVWPNLVQACRQQELPLVLVNARMNERSFRRALRMPWLSRPAYSGLGLVLAQQQEDADRLSRLGASVQGVFGNLKFDLAPDPDLLAPALMWRHQCAHKPVVMLASSREGEELMWLQALRSGDMDAVQWLVVPRHPQRFDEVARLLAEHGHAVQRRSQWPGALPSAPSAARGSHVCVWLGDTVGEMPLYYGLSDACLLGGSFACLGGQNLIEAAACECPVVMGPHTFNFAQVSEQALDGGAALRSGDMATAVRVAIELATNPLQRDFMAQASQHFAVRHRGAAAATAQFLGGLYPDLS